MKTKRQYIPRNFASYLRSKRATLKITQNKLAIISGVSQRNISHYEVGNVTPRLSNFLALVKVLEK